MKLRSTLGTCLFAAATVVLLVANAERAEAQSAANSSEAAYARRLYQIVLGREPEAGAAEGRGEQIRGGMTHFQAARDFYGSPEYANRRESDTDFVRGLYRLALCREAEPAGVQHHVGLLQNGMSRIQMVEAFFGNDEARGKWNSCLGAPAQASAPAPARDQQRASQTGSGTAGSRGRDRPARHPRQGAAPTQSRPISIVSAMGGKCLDAEGGGRDNGTRLIGYACSGAPNQQFVVHADGTIRQGGKCVDAAGGQGQDGDQILLWDCHGGPNQKWQYTGGQLVGMNGKCIDLKGGRGHWLGNQEAILWSCNNEDHQRWMGGRVVPQSSVADANVLPAGELFPRDARQLFPPFDRYSISPSAGVVAAGGANVVAAGGANVVAAGGANVVAVGGAN